MKARFIEDGELRLGLQFEPETDDERLLMRAFAHQAMEVENRMQITGWGTGGSQPGMRHVSLRLEQRPKTEAK